MSDLRLPILPAFADLHLETLVQSDTTISITATVAVSTGTCPDCGLSSTRVHSSYFRHPRDLPWAGLAVHLALRVRRFFCDTPSCARTTFVEQVEGLTRPYAQRTIGLNTALQTLGLALGGEAGAALGEKLGFMASADTILRRIRSMIPQVPSAPRVVGIDEWAIRKGRRYGSIIVDLERHRPIALLPKHAPELITQWFQQHPSIEVVARDRASIYTEALAKGAPNAQQVADRWHLCQNLGSAIQEMLAHHTKTLRAVACHLTAERMPAVKPSASPNLLPTLEPSGHVVGPIEMREHQFAEAKHLSAAGWSYRRIAEHLDLNRRTVVKYVQAKELPRRILPQSTSCVTPYLDYVRERWAAGYQHGPQMLAALKERGYQGSLSSIYRVLKGFRTNDGRKQATGSAVKRVAVRSVRQAMWLLLGAEQALSEEDKVYRTALCEQEEQIRQATILGQRFLMMVRGRQAAALDSWLTDAEMSGITELRNFAHSLRRDYTAVKVGLSVDWNNGMTEGHVNRLKMIKRTMFGRASFELLRNRVLYAS